MTFFRRSVVYKEHDENTEQILFTFPWELCDNIFAKEVNEIMAQAKHKYRINIYLGKENYEMLEKYAQQMMLPVATLCRVIFATGLEVSKALEKEVKNDGTK